MVAVAGDEVRTAGPDVVLVDGTVVSRGAEGQGAHGASKESAGAAVRSPGGHVYILGDDVRSSVDSRTLGPMPEGDVLGTVASVIRKPW